MRRSRKGSCTRATKQPAEAKPAGTDRERVELLAGSAACAACLDDALTEGAAAAAELLVTLGHVGTVPTESPETPRGQHDIALTP